jgi:hypothetical protein
MRLSDLLEHDVVDQHGHRWGQVHDVYLVQDGPVVGPAAAAFRLHGLVAGRGAFGTQLGYVGRPGYGEDQQTRGPWVIGALVRRLHRGAVYIPWADVVEVRARQITVQRPPEGFEPAASARPGPRPRRQPSASDRS